MAGNSGLAMRYLNETDPSLLWDSPYDQAGNDDELSVFYQDLVPPGSTAIY